MFTGPENRSIASKMIVSKTEKTIKCRFWSGKMPVLLVMGYLLQVSLFETATTISCSDASKIFKRPLVNSASVSIFAVLFAGIYPQKG